VTVTNRVGNRVGQSKSKAAPTDVIEEHYRQLTHREKVEFTLLVRQELANGVLGAIRTLAKVANDGKPAQAAVAAARQIVLLSEKHGILKSSIDPLQSFSDELMAELSDREDDSTSVES
jgi:hypothetical protein